MTEKRLQHQPPPPRPGYAAPVPGDAEPRIQQTDGVSTLIPYRNPKALIGYYCGVFSLIPGIGLVSGPAAIVLGILGLRFVRQNPSAKGTAHAVVALVLGPIGAVWNLLLVGLALAVAFAAASAK